MSKPTKHAATIEFARKLHGHVGPYLVIGLKMGIAAKKALKVSNAECTLLKAQVAVPLHPPFSCLLDGIQVATTCTVGNQRLQIENAENIKATFTMQKQEKTVKITLTPRFSEQLKLKQAQDQLTEQYAIEIANMPENQLFDIALE
ncbi:MAG: formylmethanofuran dehydrogenase subunit E family protein [Candidatus Bathyarchaeota archaeon]|nr:formylmethanofuran dehydrogenase subunit E family protein [Candidatus Bathyarchaeota archaeon]